MVLAIFDLDNTLLNGDSDHAWGEFACEQGLVDTSTFSRQNNAFYKDYQQGTLDIEAYLRFSLSPLKGRSLVEADRLHELFMHEKIIPMMQTKAAKLLEQHRSRGDTLLIITATNHFVTAPIAKALGVPHLIACDVEIQNEHYTGEPIGIPSFQEGKVKRLRNWLKEQNRSMKGAWFYSDSHNDLPLLQQVDKPVAVDPDPILQATAERKGWPIMSLREEAL